MRPTLPILTEHECALLVTKAAEPHTSYYVEGAIVRDSLLVLLMLDAGLRVGEAVNMPITTAYTLRRPNDSLLIKPSTSKSIRKRLLPCTPALLKALRDYLDWNWPADDQILTGPLFPGRDPSRAMAVRTAEQIMNKLSLLAFNRSVNCHALRHTFATRLMEVTSIRVIQDLLGHTSAQSTEIYTHPSQNDLDAAINGNQQQAPQNPTK